MSKLPKLTDEEITALSHEQLADALIARDMAKENVPARKVDRIAALQAYEPEADAPSKTEEELAVEEMDRRDALTQEERDAEDRETLRRSNLTDAQRAAEDAAEGKTKAVQNGTGKRIEAKSTAPEKPKTTTRPYLDSPRDFGIHIEGHLVKFKKGRNPIVDSEYLTQAQIVKGIKAESYVDDNGAELVE